VCVCVRVFVCVCAYRKCAQVLGSSDNDRKRWEDIIFTFYQNDVVDVSNKVL